MIEFCGSKRDHDLSFGVLSVMSYHKSLKRRQISTPYTLGPSDGQIDFTKETYTRIQYLPRLESSRRGNGFHAVTHQRHDRRGTYSAIPTLSINNILPFGSLVFTLVEQGRMTEFLEMLRSGKASLRDHDEYGASLLFVSRLLNYQ